MNSTYVTEVVIKHAEDPGDKVKAYINVTLNGHVAIHDMKIIRGDQDNFFMAMPSRRIQDRCQECGHKNPVTAKHCSDCGGVQKEARHSLDHDGRPKLYADIVHPTDSNFRAYLEQVVLTVWEAQCLLEQQLCELLK